jgi:hypothetical protein
MDLRPVVNEFCAIGDNNQQRRKKGEKLRADPAKAKSKVEGKVGVGDRGKCEE